jgi:hypothetical protein
MRRLGLIGICLTAALGLGAIASAEVAQKGNLRVNFEGKISPSALPRSGETPVNVSVSAKVSSTGTEAPPPMAKMSIAINKYGHLQTGELPICRLEDIQPATTDDALAACKRSLVGEGRFLATVLQKGAAPFPSDGKIYAFNGELDGKPAILAHVYGTKPAPASYTISFLISRSAGTFGTTLKATLPPVKEGSGYITGISLKMGKSFISNPKGRSYFTASCPAPKGASKAVFSFAEASVGFKGGPSLKSTLTRTCEAKGR